MRWRLLFVFATTMTMTRPAHAGALASARLEYTRGPGAESCPDATVVRSAVKDTLGYDPFTESSDAPMLTADIRRDESEHSAPVLRAKVHLVDRQGKSLGARELTHDASRCDELVKLMALSMSIALDPEALDRPKAAAAPPPTPTAKEPPPTPPAAPSEPMHLEMGAAPAAWVGAAPAPSFGGLIFVALRPISALSIAIEGRLDLAASRRFPAGFVETSLTMAALVPCVHLLKNGLLELCAVGAVGSLHAQSREVTQPKEASSLHVLAGGRVGIDVPLITGRLWLWVHTNGLAALTSQTLALDGAEVYTLPRVAGGMGVGFRVRFL